MRSLDLRMREALLCALVLLQLAYSWMYSEISVPNERTRVYLTIALVDHATLAIDEPVRRFGRVFDLASFRGHYFTDKAPGASLMAVPVYGFARLWRPAAAFSVVDVINLVRTYLMVPIGLLGFVVLRSLLRALGVSEPSVDVSSLGFSLGSPMLHYSGAFYSHAIVAVLALGSLRCLAWAGVLVGGGTRTGAGTGTGTSTGCSWGRRRAFGVLGAGACAGLCGLTEYQAVVLAVLLGLPIVLNRGSSWFRDLALFALGGAPFAGALLAYNACAFGAAFALSYQHLVGATLQDLHGEGLVGATHPHWEAMAGLLLSEHRGLLLTAPLLGLGLLTLAFGTRFVPRALWFTLTSSLVYFVLIVASSSVWYGGWSFGPRLLVPVMGLLAVAVALFMDAWRSHAVVQMLCRAGAVVGVLYQHAVHATFPELPPSFARPLPDSALPLFRAGLAAPNLACKLIGLGPHTWAPLAVLVAGTVAILVCRGLAGRRLVTWASLVTAGSVFALLAAAQPSIDGSEQQQWLRQVRAWQSTERRCRG
jgi:hypothetical protein